MNDINPIIIKLLNNRGISGEDEIVEFLSEKPQKTYDPFRLLNMEAGVDLILSAIWQGKKICIYGDYDADGITSISLMMKVLSNLTDKLEYYIPSRFDEGYGLNMSAIKSIYDAGADLIITVDCGSASHEEVKYAKELGLEIVITDHHSMTDAIADCLVINPKQPNCEYPFKHLAGVGVAFKLAQAIQQKAELPKSVLLEVLDLVAIGTIGDVVPLLDENRTLVKYGIKELNYLNRKGMKEFIKTISPKTNVITSENVAFMIVPHLNAVGRMLNANSAVELLIADENNVIRANIEQLVESNRNRKQIQEETYEQCVEIVDKHLNEKKCLMICSPDAHEGITGIVAGKIKDKYNKPTIIVTQSGDLCKGTGRSLDRINMYDLLKNFEEFFVKFGGHSGACGFLMQHGNLCALKDGLEEKVTEIYEFDNEIFDEDFGFDMEISGQDITAELGELLECLAPFGNQNRKPIFCVTDVNIKDVIAMGEDGKHVRFTGHCPDGKVLQCVLFNKAKEYQEIIESKRLISILGSVEVQVWNGNKRVQFVVEKFKEKM